MVIMTMDYKTSYRAITDADLAHQLHRETHSWEGKDIPRNEVIGTSPLGDIVLSAASTYVISCPYTLLHSAYSGHLDLFSTENIPGLPYLRYELTVEGPPLWENYVQPSYANPFGFQQWAIDVNAWELAMSAWVIYMETHLFQATTATLSDDGGDLGQYTSDAPQNIEDFQDPREWYSCRIHGSNFDDNFSGGLLACSLYGGLGDDTLTGKTADDRIFGGDGSDSLFGEAGKEIIFGGDGDDRLFGNAGSDTLKGGNGADDIQGGLGNDSLFGQAGKDKLYGHDGKDSLDGDADSDTLDGGIGADSLAGGDGNDSLIGDSGNDTLYGDAGNDVPDRHRRCRRPLWRRRR